MPSLRVLTVDLADLNLETDVINGAKVEISIERTTTFDSFVIAPSLDYKATSDETGILTFNILPSDANTITQFLLRHLVVIEAKPPDAVCDLMHCPPPRGGHTARGSPHFWQRKRLFHRTP